MADESLGTLSIELSADSDQLTQAFNKATSAINQLNDHVDEMQHHTEDAHSGFESLGHAIEALALVEVFEKANEAVKELQNAFADDHDAVQRLSTVVSSVDTEKFEQLASILSTTSTNSKVAEINAASLLGQFNLTDRQIAELMPVLNDYATVTGKDLPAAAQAFGRAILSGNANARTLGLSIGQVNQQLFQEGDQTTRVNILLDSLGKFHGSAAAQAQTAAGAQKQLDNSAEELKATLGGLMDKPLATWYQGLNSSMQSTTTLVQSLKPEWQSFLGNTMALAPELVKVSAALVGVSAGVKALGGIGNIVEGVTDAFKGMAAGVGTVLLPILGIAAAMGAIAAGATTIAGLAHIAQNNAQNGTNSESGKGFLQVISDGFTTGLKDTVGGWKDILSGILLDPTKQQADASKNSAVALQNLTNEMDNHSKSGDGIKMDFRGMGEDYVSKSQNGFATLALALDDQKAHMADLTRQLEEAATGTAEFKQGLLTADQQLAVAKNNRGFTQQAQTQQTIYAMNTQTTGGALAKEDISNSTAMIQGDWTKLMTNLSADSDNILSGGFTDLFDDLSTGGTSLWNDLKSGVGGVITDLMQHSAAFGAIISTLNSAGMSVGMDLMRAAGSGSANFQDASTKKLESANTRSLTSGAGNVSGQGASNAVSALSKGDWMGAIVSLVTGVLQGTKAFGKIIDAVTKIMGVLSSALNPLMDAIVPIINIVVELVENALGPLKPVIQLLSTALIAVAGIIQKVFVAIANVWNNIVNAIKKFLDLIPALAHKLDSALNDAKLIIDPAAGTENDTITGNMNSLADAATNASSSLNSMASSAQNVPTGFYTAYAVYQASQGTGFGITPTAAAGGANVTNNNQINITTQVDSTTLAAAIAKQLSIISYNSTGNSGSIKSPLTMNRLGGV